MFVTRKWAPAVGGMETYSLRLTEALAAIEPVEVVALRGKANGMPPGVIALLTFPFRVLTRFLSRKIAPDILHVGDMALWPVGLLALLGVRTKVALSAHGTDVAYHRRGGLKGALYGAYLRLGAKLLGKATVIANSHATSEVLRETGWDRSVVVPLATDLAGPAPDGSHNGRILFVGRLVERKGCGWFVREVLPLIDEGVILDVAGTGWDTGEQSAIDHPRVNFLGSLHGEDLIDAYRNAMCVIVPNIATQSGEYEGFGLVAPEAAACGAYVLTANRDGLRDAIIAGKTGHLVEAGDSKAWAEAIMNCTALAKGDRIDFLTQSVETARQVYSWDRVARETTDAYGIHP
ncbi:glycosyltransferase family 4 protein [Croceicoccus gelatinilyticus]|uniref:glycosyltransferase family 4 protein n=1 Tax=Croceicoccus gelatinilyticus TaxID=2835536 RepID=UPI001BCCE9F9|nr:glycosyltransferase family 4 protein [Croceicoccus gelatinilyticus]